MAPTKTEKELLAKINDQEEQLIRYKKRLQGIMHYFSSLNITREEKIIRNIRMISSVVQ